MNKNTKSFISSIFVIGIFIFARKTSIPQEQITNEVVVERHYNGVKRL